MGARTVGETACWGQGPAGDADRPAPERSPDPRGLGNKRPVGDAGAPVARWENASVHMANCLDTPEDDRRGGRAGGADRGSSVADELRTAIQTGSEVRRGAGEPAAEGHGWGDGRI